MHIQLVILHMKLLMKLKVLEFRQARDFFSLKDLIFIHVTLGFQL